EDDGKPKKIEIADLLPPSDLLPTGKSRDYEIREGPEVSPDGEMTAFAVRPCGRNRPLDIVESYGLIGLYERKSGAVRILVDSGLPNGSPRGYAYGPVWSDDGKRLLVRYETGFRILRVPEGTLVLLVFDAPIDSNTLGLGWLGSQCVIYGQGTDFDKAL